MKISEGLKKLTYDTKKILSYNLETINTFVPKSGKLENNKFIVTTKTKKSIEDNLFDISIITSSLDRIYLGSILLANNKLLENFPTEISCNKGKISFKVNNLNGLKSDESIAEIENPTSSKVMSKIEEISNLWLSKYNNNNHSTILEYKESIINSESQFIAEFGLESKKIINKLNINSDYSNNKKIYICKLKQIYFSASLDIPKNVDEFINENWEDFSSKGIDNNNPPVYVSNIDFGRIIYIKFETNENSNKVKEAFSSVIKGIDISQNSEYKNIINNSTFNIIIIGGSLNEYNGSGLDSITKIKNIINEGIKFTNKSPAFPISYTTTFLKNNEIAMINSKTDYIETKSEIYNNCELTLKHTGAYVAKFNVSWNEINYDNNGNEIIKHIEWSENNKSKTAPYKTIINLPGNATNLNISAKGATGLVWEKWRTNINKTNITLNDKITIEIYGTTLNQKYKIENK